MKPAQKLKGARLEAGQTHERDDASLLAHREESKHAVFWLRGFWWAGGSQFLRFGWAAERMQWGTRWWCFMPFSR